MGPSTIFLLFQVILYFYLFTKKCWKYWWLYSQSINQLWKHGRYLCSSGSNIHSRFNIYLLVYIGCFTRKYFCALYEHNAQEGQRMVSGPLWLELQLCTCWEMISDPPKDQPVPLTGSYVSPSLWFNSLFKINIHVYISL